MDLLTLVVWMFLIGFLFVSIIIFARIYLGRKKSRVLHQLSADTFAWLKGEVKFNKLHVKDAKFDLTNVKAYMVRSATGFKPFYITSYGRNRPLQVKGDYLVAEKLSPKIVQDMGKVEALGYLIKASVGRLNRTTIIFSVMAFIMGLLLGIVAMKVI